MPLSACCRALIGIALLLPGLATAQEGSMVLELLSMRDTEDTSCRMTFVARNNTGLGFSALSYEMVIWDQASEIPSDGILVFDFGQMPRRKTKVVQFDLPARGCGEISRVLVNDSVECVATEGASDVCLTSLIATTRGAVPFDY